MTSDNTKKVSAHINKIRFHTGLNVDLRQDSILVLVGPNNSGKSQTIFDIYQHIKGESKNFKSVSEVDIKKIGTQDEFKKYVDEQSIIKNDSRHISGVGSYSPPDVPIENYFKRNNLGFFTSIFAQHIRAEDRIKATQAADRIDFYKEMPHIPIHYLEKYHESEVKVSTLFNKIFSQNINLSRSAGRKVRIHVGTKPNIQITDSSSCFEYDNEIRKLPVISDQGDGMISCLGLFMYVIGWPKDIYLIDESDIYLHPPQAHATGAIIARETAGRQLIIATHSAHFLRGLIETSGDRLILIRLDNTSNEYTADNIDRKTFENIKNNSSIKFTPLLDAVFYKKVIVCEDETDCLFYRSMLMAMELIDWATPVFWLSAHGKQNLHKMIDILGQLGVKHYSMADFDLINKETTLFNLIKAHGGNRDDFQENFNKIQKDMNAKKSTFSTTDIKREIQNIIDSIDDSETLFSPDDENKIKEVFRKASPWRELKNSGLSALSRGEVYQAGINLRDKLKDIGIFISDVGELESFYPTIGKHGIKWVSQVLSKDLKSDPNLNEARKYIEQIGEIVNSAD